MALNNDLPNGLLLQVILVKIFELQFFVSIIMHTSEHTHSVPQDSDQTQRTCHQQIQLEYVIAVYGLHDLVSIVLIS